MATTRNLREICNEIRSEWKNMSEYAKPYFDAMRRLDSVNDSYGYDDGKTMVLYFLSNAQSWRGESARRIKAELKAMCK